MIKKALLWNLIAFLGINLLLFNNAKANIADHVVINEVQTGESGSGNADNEYIKLFNPTSSDIDLKEIGLKVHIRNKSGTDYNKPLNFINTTIRENESFLIAPNNEYSILIGADATYSTSGNKLVSNGGVYISSSTKADINVIDKVGWGSQPLGGYESSPFSPDIPIGKSIKRKENGWDSNNNAKDFIIAGQNDNNENSNTASENNLDGVYINEIMPNPASPKTDSMDEWIEIFNSNDYRVDLTGAILRDTAGSSREYSIPAGIFIDAGRYAIFYSSATKITLNNDGDSVEFLDNKKNIIDKTPNYGKAEDGLSYSLFEEGWDWTLNPTPLSENIYAEISETEEKTGAEKKSKTKKTAKKTGAKSSKKTSKTGVKGAKSSNNILGENEINDKIDNEKQIFNWKNKNVGIFLIFLGIFLGVNYIIFRDKIYEFYKQKFGTDI